MSIKVTIDDKIVETEEGYTIIQACENAGVEIPRFCYHEKLKIAGNCRMCLVEVEGGPPKPVASCAMPVADGMVIKTNTEMVKKAREGVMEFLLINHPLDCPICDQGGECDLQDQAIKYGSAISYFHEDKRAVPEKNMGPFIKTHMTRCIHCTRCVRFIEEIAGTYELGAINRGEKMEILAAVGDLVTSELSGNIIDLCPVGALTSRPYAFKARSWELQHYPSIDVMDAMGSNIQLDCLGNEVMRILPRPNDEINADWINDRIRFSYDGLINQRLESPYIRKDGQLTACNWDEALRYVVAALQKYKGQEMAAIVGNLADCESIFALKTLMKNLHCKNLECRNGLQIDPENKNTFISGINIAQTEESDLIILIGANPRFEASALNIRLRKAALAGGKIFVIGDNENLNYPNINLGNNPEILMQILENQHEICNLMNNAQKPLIIAGSEVMKRDYGEEILNICMQIAQRYNCVQENWHGFITLHDSASLTGAMIMHFTSVGNIQNIIKKIDNEEIKLVYLLNADEIDMAELGNAFVIYQGHHGDNGAHRADLILPDYIFTEKNATYINLEGRIQHTVQATLPPKNSMEDWQTINSIIEKMGFEKFQNIAQLQQKMNQKYKIFDYFTQKTHQKWQNIELKTTQLNNDQHIKSINEKFNFYLNNPISRASKNMIDFVQQIKKKEKTYVF